MSLPPTIHFTGRCWRVLAPRWAHAPLSGEGAARQGGRWNRPGTPALYLSLDLMTAVAEYEQDLGIRPGTFCAYEVDVAGIVDLVDPNVRAAADVSEADLVAPWKELWLLRQQEPPGWPLQDRLLAEGAAGLRVPSARDPRGLNLLLWRWNNDPAHHVTALDPGRDLPQDASSWPS